VADQRLKKRGQKNGKDVWTAIIPLARDANGKRRQHRFTFIGTKREAEKAFIAGVAAVDNGTFVTPDRATFGDYLTDWLAGAKTQFAGKTWERYESMTRMHVKPKLGNVRLQNLTAAQLSKAYAERRATGLSGQTVIHHHRLIHRVLAQALREGRVRQNVAALATRPKATRKEMRFLNADEIKRIVSAAEGTPFAPLIAIALSTGARRGELLGVKWDDPDLRRGTLSIRRSLQDIRAGVSEKTPKSGKSRVVALPAGAIDVLREHRIAQARSTSSVVGGYIFAGPDGGAWTPVKVTDGFLRLCRRAKVVGASFHTLRHTCASLLLSQGVHPKVVQEMLGHSTIAITMDLYSHSTPSLQDDAARRLDDALRGPLKGTGTTGA
jgi:integrase